MDSQSASDLLKWRKKEEEAFASGDAAGLSEALAGQAELVEDPEESAGLYYRAGAAAEAAGDRERALELLEKAEGAEPWASLSRLHRVELHWAKGEWQSMADLLAADASSGAGWDERTLRLERARLMAFRLGLHEEASAEIQSILANDPSAKEAIWMSLALSLRSGDWEGVTKNYEKLHDAGAADSDNALAASAALRLGQIREFRSGDREGAGKWYEKAGKEPITMVPALEIAEASGDWQKVASGLTELMAAVDSEGTPPEIRVLLARVYDDLLMDEENATAQYKVIAEKNPEDFSSLYSVAEKAMESGDPSERAESDANLARVLADPKEKAFFTADRARILLDDLGDPAGAAEAARAWLELVPDSVDAGHFLIDALVRAKSYDEALAEIEREIGRTKDQRELQGLLFKKAEMALHKMEDEKTSLEAYLKALEVPPSQFPILLSIANLYNLSKDYANEARALTAAMKLVQDESVKRYYQHRLAYLYLDRLGKVDQAFGVFAEIIKADQSDYVSLRGVLRISKKKEAWQNTVGALQRIADAVTDENLKKELRLRMAWLTETRLSQPDQALVIYKELASDGNAFALDSTRRILYSKNETAHYAGTLNNMAEATGPASLKAARLTRLGAAREVLGELADAWAAYEKARVSFSDKPHLFLPMLDISQLAGYWARYASLLEEYSGMLSESGQRALLWEAAWSRAEFAGQSGKLDPQAMHRAFQAMEEATGESQASLRGAFLASIWMGDHKMRADLMARMIKSSPDGLSDALRIRLGVFLRNKLGAKEESIAALRQALARHQKSAPLIRELQLMYTQEGQWGELIRMLLLELPLRKDPAVQVDMYGRLAKLYEENFKAVDEAIKCHRAVLRIAPDRSENHQELIRLLTGKGDWEGLLAAIEGFEKTVEDPAEKIQLLNRAASIADEKINDADRAISYLKRSLDLDPSNVETLNTLEKLYEREERWADLVDVLKEQAGKVEEPESKAGVYEKIADITENRLADKEGAVAHLVTARDIAPEKMSVLQGLERLYEELGRWSELIDTLERLAAITPDEQKVGYLSRIGTLWDEKLQDPEKSIQSWEKVRGIDAGNVPALEALVSLYERTGAHALFVERSRELATLVKEDTQRAVDILCKAGQTAESQLQDEDQALGIYSEAMDTGPSIRRPIELARKIRERREEWPQVVELLGKEEAVAEQPEEKLEIFTRMGDIQIQKIEDRNEAAKAYQKALSIKEDHLPAAKPLAEIYFAVEEFKAARPLYELWTKALEGEEPQEAARVWYRAGWCAEKTDDVDTAMSRYHSSLEVVPDYRASLERLSDLYLAKEDWENTVSITERLVAVTSAAQDVEASFAGFVRIGDSNVKIDRPDKAASAYEQALQYKPGTYDVLAKLIDIYKKQERWKDSLVLYDQLIKAAPEPALRAEGLADKGEVLQDKIGQVDSALAHFQAATQQVPDHLRSWKRMAEIYYEKKAWQEAEGAFGQVLRLEPEDKDKVEPHYKLGLVYREGLRDLEKARDQFQAAIKIDEMHIPATQALGDIYLELEQWQDYVNLGEKFVKMIPQDKQEELTTIYRKMGEVYRDHLDNKERAIINFQQVLKLDPEDDQARSDLTAIYVSDPKFVDQAKSESLNLIRYRPFQERTYRDLAKIQNSQKNLDAVFWIYAIMHQLDIAQELDYEQQMFYEANMDKQVRSSKRTLRDVEREGQLVHPDERGALRDMMVALGENLQKAFTPPANRYGVKKGNQLPDDSNSPINKLALEIMTNLGLPDFRIHLVTSTKEPQVFHTTPPTLAVNQEWFNSFSELEQRFILGRCIEHMIGNHAVVFHFPPAEVLKTLCTVAAAAEPSLNLKIPGTSGEDVKKAKKLIPWTGKVKANIEHAAQRFTQETVDTNPEEWKKAIIHTGNRAGLVACSDLPSAFSAIIKTDPKYQNIKYDQLGDPKSVWRENEYVIELLSFAVSDSYFRIRQQIGFSIT